MQAVVEECTLAKNVLMKNWNENKNVLAENQPPLAIIFYHPALEMARITTDFSRWKKCKLWPLGDLFKNGNTMGAILT